MPALNFVTHDGQTYAVDAEIGQSVMNAAVNNLVPGILADCGGACICATCHVMVDKTWKDRLPEPESSEAAMLLGAIDVTDTSRLSCQIPVSESLDGIIFHLPPEQV